MTEGVVVSKPSRKVRGREEVCAGDVSKAGLAWLQGPWEKVEGRRQREEKGEIPLPFLLEKHVKKRRKRKGEEREREEERQDQGGGLCREDEPEGGVSELPAALCYTPSKVMLQRPAHVTAMRPHERSLIQLHLHLGCA